MPSIAPRPLQQLLVCQFSPLEHDLVEASSDGESPSKRSLLKTEDSPEDSDNDSEVSETSTFTNSPLSCYHKQQAKLAVSPSTPQDPTSVAALAFPESSEEEQLPPSNSKPSTSPSQTSSSSSEDVHPRKPTSPQEQEGDTESESESESDSESEVSADTSSSAASDHAQAAPKSQEELNTANITTTKSPKKKTTKKSVGFEALSTLYVFEDDASGNDEKGYYDIDNTWYSVQELKAFRADAFLTVNWMVMKGIQPGESQDLDSSLDSSSSHHSHSRKRGNHKKNPKKNESYCYYSNKYGYDRQKEINAIAQQANYEFCERGVECRTPLGRYVKNKRRMDAMRVVMLYQQMQKQHRRERRREQRRQQQMQYHDEEYHHTTDHRLNRHRRPQHAAVGIRRHTPNLQALKKVEADIDAEALANVYGSYCEESIAEALARGQADAVATGMSPKPIPSDEEEQEEATPEPSSQDKDDEFMDKLVNLSIVHHSFEDDEESDDDSEAFGDDEGSFGSDTSMSLQDLQQVEDEEEDEVNNSVVEVELVEGNHEQPHRIYCSESSVAPRPSCTMGRRRRQRQKSWSHPISCASTDVVPSTHQLEAAPTSSSFSSLELGGLFFGAVTGLDWW